MLGAGAVGVVAYLILRPRRAAAAPAPTGLPAQRPQPQALGLGGPTTNIPIGPNGPDPSPSLVARLASDDNARQIFALQANAYTVGYTNAVPDGIEGSVTDTVISNLTNGTYTSYSPAAFSAARQALDAYAVQQVRSGAGAVGGRQLPFTLPSGIIGLVNQSAANVDSGAHPVNAATTEVASTTQESAQPQSAQDFGGVPAPAGQAIPVAGYSRPPSMQMMNSVGGNPGWGVIVDPNGLNIGLWEMLAGWQHAPNGTGSIAADLKRNPIAGQGGLYWNAWPSFDAIGRGVTP